MDYGCVMKSGYQIPVVRKVNSDCILLQIAVGIAMILDSGCPTLLIVRHKSYIQKFFMPQD